jgi:hypothetical protein
MLYPLSYGGSGCANATGAAERGLPGSEVGRRGFDISNVS